MSSSKSIRSFDNILTISQKIVIGNQVGMSEFFQIYHLCLVALTGTFRIFLVDSRTGDATKMNVASWTSVFEWRVVTNLGMRLLGNLLDMLIFLVQ